MKISGYFMKILSFHGKKTLIKPGMLQRKDFLLKFNVFTGIQSGLIAP